MERPAYVRKRGSVVIKAGCWFADINSDEEKLEMMKSEYQWIRDRLEQLVEEGSIDEFYRQTILDMSERVIMNIAEKYDSIAKEVGTIMGGQIIETEAKRILNAGLETGRTEGRAEGLVEGRAEGMFDTLIALVKDGILSVADAAARAGVTEADFLQKMENV